MGFDSEKEHVSKITVAIGVVKIFIRAIEVLSETDWTKR